MQNFDGNVAVDAPDMFPRRAREICVKKEEKEKEKKMDEGDSENCKSPEAS